MLFNSLEFGVFFAILLAVYWLLYKNRNAQNLILLAGSLIFYAWLHYSFPIYLMAMVSVSYVLGKLIGRQENEKRRKGLLILSLVVLSAGLIYTKYSGFILGNIKGLESWEAGALHILVPVGISFYTFAILGYILDVYYEAIEPEANYLTFATYICFFPQLLSGPIPAATTVLPQFKKKATVSVNSVTEGIGEFLWGLFKKMVVADNISMAVSYCFSANNVDLSGSSLFIGAALFGINIYADFSGYSSMARGCAKMFGIDIIQNFNLPLFSKSVAEYWRRWHISLTNWLYSYIYNPLVFGLKRWGKWGVIVGIFITFFISGIWHGAGWQFIVFGVVNGIAIIFEILTKDIRTRLLGKMPSWLGGLISTFVVLIFMLFSWIFFRANDLAQAMRMIGRICSGSLFSAPDTFVVEYLVWGIPMVVIEWLQRKGRYTLDVDQWLPTKVVRKRAPKNKKIMMLSLGIKLAIYVAICLSIYFFHKKVDMAEYYYFKF